MSFDVKYFIDAFPDLLKYINYTILMAVASTLIGFVLASVLALIRIFNIKGLSQIVNIFISFFRSTPLLVQLFIFYYGLPQIIKPLKDISPLTAMIVGLSLCGSAYMAEVIRGAITSADYRPFAYIDQGESQDKVKGLEIDIWNEIAKRNN